MSQHAPTRTFNTVRYTGREVITATEVSCCGERRIGIERFGQLTAHFVISVRNYDATAASF